MRILFFLLLIIGSLSSGAQLNGQLDTIVQKYTLYHKTEKEFFYTHFNKAVYFTGENIWFKIYVLNLATRLPFLPTRNMHAELYDASGRLVEKKLLYVTQGSTHGDFRLGDSLPPGTYTFRAYTNWSKNFGPAFYFTQPLTVLGRSDSISGEPQELSAKLDVQFFPEGGAFVSDIQNTMAFKVVNTEGFGVPVEGTLKMNGKPVQRLSTNAFGMGRFKLMPTVTGVFTATFPSVDKDSFTVSLPRPMLKGITLTADAITKDSIMVSVFTNSAALKEVRGQEFYIMAHRQGKGTFFKGKFGSFHKFILPKSYFPEGVAHLTLFDHKNQPIANRAVFVPPVRPTFQINAKKEDDSVMVEFQTGLADQPLSSNISVSILPAGTVANDYGRNIYSRYFLEGDIRGYVEHPAYYFEGDWESRKADMDNLLLVHGWRSYDWNAILNSHPDTTTYPFHQGFTIKGVIPGYRQRDEKDTTTLSLISTANNILLDTKVDKDGAFEFLYLYLRDSSQVMLNTASTKWKSSLKDISIGLEGASFDSAAVTHFALKPKKTLKGQPSLTSNPAMLQEVFIRTSVPEPKLFQGDPLVNMGDRTYKVDAKAIERHRTLQDLLRTQFGVNSTVNEAGDVMIKMMSGAFSISSPDLPPTLIIDGLAMSNLNMLRTLRVTDVEAIAVNKHGNTMLGSRGAGGSIVIKTRTDPNALRPVADDAVKTLWVKGYAAPSSYFSPSYAVSPTHSFFVKYGTLYWEPRVITDSAGKSAIRIPIPKEINSFKLRAEGVTVNGQLLYADKEVRF